MSDTSALDRSRFFDVSVDLMIIAEIGGKVLELNPAWERILGYTVEELMARPLVELIHPDDLQKTMAIGPQLLSGGSVVEFENRYRCKDGSYKWLAWSSTLDAERGRLFATARDINDRKRMEVELAQKELQYRNLVDTAQDLIWSTDREGKLTFMNQACKTIYGYEPEELIGRFFPDVSGNLERSREAFGVLMAGGPLRRYETIHRHKDGSLRHVLINAVPILDEQGNVTGATGTASDITEHKRAQERLTKQADAIRSMATPIIQVWDEVVAMPIIGVMDSQRAAQVMEALLGEIVKTRTRFAILDLTGVEIVDTSTANYLLQMVRAVSLLGGTCIVSGISPPIASTMVGLGIEIGSLMTFGTLQAALRYAIQVAGREQAPRSSS